VRGRRVKLLEADPDLGRWLTPDEIVVARELSVVPVLRLPCGRWIPPACQNRKMHLGFLLLDGLIGRDELLAGVRSTEFLGPGELLQPWTQQSEDLLVPRNVRWVALEPTWLAVLGPSFVAATAPWPALRSALLERAMRRCAWLSTQHALCQLSRVDMRLLLLFWHLAERWGRVGARGMVVPLSMSHATLGHLVGAKRSTVTRGLQRLAADGLVERRADGSWLLDETAEVARRNRADEEAMAKKISALWDLAVDLSFKQEGLDGAPPFESESQTGTATDPPA
jgi:CRP/FNR family transcriptional regulator, cyclic AMP receptor protein